MATWDFPSFNVRRPCTVTYHSSIFFLRNYWFIRTEICRCTLTYHSSILFSETTSSFEPEKVLEEDVNEYLFLFPIPFLSNLWDFNVKWIYYIFFCLITNLFLKMVFVDFMTDVILTNGSTHSSMILQLC
jgi:hypothetical protein